MEGDLVDLKVKATALGQMGNGYKAVIAFSVLAFREARRPEMEECVL